MSVDSYIGVSEVLQPSASALLRRRVFGHTTFVLGAGTLLLILAAALTAPLLAPHDPYAQDLGQRLIPPVWHDEGSWAHVLGTDQLGRDYLSRLIYGTRLSLLIGSAAMLMSGVIGASLGVFAGYFGGRLDLV